MEVWHKVREPFGTVYLATIAVFSVGLEVFLEPCLAEANISF